MHVIRLRKPWQRCREDGSDPVRIDVPETGSQPRVDQGVLLYSRHFNLPSGLQPSARVHLRIDGWQGQLEAVTVNEKPVHLDGCDPASADITRLLQRRNQIAVQLAGLPGQGARLSGQVTLVIDEGDP